MVKTERCRYLPLAVLFQGQVFRNHIIEISGDNITLFPFIQEIEATTFVSTFIAVVSAEKLPQITSNSGKYASLATSLDELCKLLVKEQLFPDSLTEKFALLAITSNSLQIIR